MARKRKSKLVPFMVLVALGALGFGALAAFRAGPPPAISLTSELPAIGKRTPILIVVEEPKRGLSNLTVEFSHGERVEVLEKVEFVPLEPWEFWGDRTRRHEMTVVVGRESIENLREGKATIRVVAERASSYLRYPEPAVAELTLDVRLRPPQLQVLSKHTYVAQGGCEAVVYKVGPTSVKDGIQAGDWWFPGHPLPGGDEQERFVLFAAPFDLDDHDQIQLLAFDDVDNQARASIVDRFFARPVKKDTIRVNDAFMERVVPAIIEQTPELSDKGDLLANYLMINGELRSSNAEELVRLAQASPREFMWNREFMQMRNAQVTSTFADHRTYLYQGKAVDQQDHLGYDLASTSRAEIQAANDGVVVLARYFGIYGNAVVIDHGYGLLSLYGHLSQIDVIQGQSVIRGDVVGRSGKTGLAGGDHLHFTMLLQGLPVDSKEWWDAHWIHDRLKLKLAGGMPFQQ